MLFSRKCLFLGLLFLSAVARAQDVCPVIPAVNVEVQSAVIQPQVKADTLQHLTALAEKVRPGEADGLTFITFDEDDQVTARTDRHGCQTFDVQVILKPSRAVVYMASSLDPDGCRYNAVSGHEMHHVQIGQDALDHTAGVLQKQLQTALPQTIALLQASHQGRLATSDLQAFVRKRAVDALRIVSVEYQAGNERLDVPAESLRLEAMCATGKRQPHAYIGDQRIN